MKTPNEVKRVQRRIRKHKFKSIRDLVRNSDINPVTLFKFQHKPLTVTNNKERVIFVAHQPIKVTTVYSNNYK